MEKKTTSVKSTVKGNVYIEKEVANYLQYSWYLWQFILLDLKHCVMKVYTEMDMKVNSVSTSIFIYWHIQFID